MEYIHPTKLCQDIVCLSVGVAKIHPYSGLYFVELCTLYSSY